MPDEEHSSLSPSGRHRWGSCPASVRLSAPYPDTAGPAALDGTRTHTLLEHLIRHEFIEKQGVVGKMAMWNTTHTDEHGTFTVDADRSLRLNVAMEYVRDFVDEHGGTVLAEERVFPDGLVNRPDMHGTVDIQIVNKRIYPIIDYKDGISPVQAFENPQLEQYAMGVLAKLDPANYPKTFRLVIIQPKLALKGLPVISTWEITPEELLARVPIIIAQAAATEDPNAPFVPGEAQCKYCKAKGICPAIAAKAMEGIGAMFSPVNPTPVPYPTIANGGVVEIVLGTMPSFLAPAAGQTSDLPYNLQTPAPSHGPLYPDGSPVPLPSYITPEVMPAGVPDMAQMMAQRDPHKMSNDQLRQVMEAAPLVNQFLEGVKKEIERKLHSGETVPGFKLVNGNGRREWALSEDEMVKKLTGMGAPKEAIFKKTLVSPAQAEKLMWDKKGEPHSWSDLQKKRMETEYIQKIPGAPVVVSESDPRPAIVKDASSLFSPTVTPSFLQAANPKPSFLK